MSDFYTIKQVVLGCASRVGSSFNTGNNNYVDIAVNNALIYAQRKCDFEWNKGSVKVVCNPTGDVMVGTDVNTGEPTKIKRVLKAFGTVAPELGKDQSVPYLSRVSQIADDTKPCCASSNVRVIHEGRRVFITPQPEVKPYDLYFYCVKWMPRLVKDEDTNFLLEYGFDFILYRSILELNFFIKEDERFQVSQAMVGDAWNTVVAWDSSLVSPTETEIEL